MDKKSFSLDLFLDTIRQESEQFGYLNEDESIVTVDEATVPEFVSHIKDIVDTFLKEQLVEAATDSYDDSFEEDEFLLMDDDDEDEDDDDDSSTIY